MQNLLNNLKKFKCQFVSVKGYESSETGEVSNYVINTGVTYENLVKKDIDKLKTAVFDDRIMEEARRELLRALDNNSDPKTRSAQSQAQIDAYEHICDGVRRHKESGKVFIQGYRISKVVLKAGVHKEVKSRPLTIAKKQVVKILNLSTPKYRQFSVGSIDALRMQGVNYEFVNPKGATVLLSENEVGQ